MNPRLSPAISPGDQTHPPRHPLQHPARKNLLPLLCGISHEDQTPPPRRSLLTHPGPLSLLLRPWAGRFHSNPWPLQTSYPWETQGMNPRLSPAISPGDQGHLPRHPLQHPARKNLLPLLCGISHEDQTPPPRRSLLTHPGPLSLLLRPWAGRFHSNPWPLQTSYPWETRGMNPHPSRAISRGDQGLPRLRSLPGHQDQKPVLRRWQEPLQEHPGLSSQIRSTHPATLARMVLPTCPEPSYLQIS